MLEHCGQHSIKIIAEERGRREDESLYKTFERIVANGTYYVRLARFQKFAFELCFVPKKRNLVGHQLADLVGAPISNHFIDIIRGIETRRDRAFDAISEKLNCPGIARSLKLSPQKQTAAL